MVVVLVALGGGVYYVYFAGSGNTATTSSTSSTSSTTSSTSSTASTSSTTSTSTTTRTTIFPLTLQAGGSSFVNPVMQVWIVSFNQFTSGAVQVNYQPVGSGAGITGVQSGTFSFAGSDAPHKNQTATQGTLLNIPESLGAVSIFYNIPGVNVNLNLTGPIIAKIYLQQITQWNDSAIISINPGVNKTLMAHTIVPVHRSDGSGTTYALTNYFTKVSTDWNASSKGYGTLVSWPAQGELAGRGSGGVAALVKAPNSYAIGYADSYYAFSNSLLSAAVQNQAGSFVLPSLAGVTAAASQFTVQLQADPTTSITNAPGSTSYPISTFTYILVWQNQSDQAKGSDMAFFFWWIVTKGQAYGPSLFYPKLPDLVVTLDETLIASMTYNGVSFING